MRAGKKSAFFFLLCTGFFLAPCRAAEPLPPAFCRALVEHVPAADVAFRPGIDVHGKPVVPADLAPQKLTLPETISFPLTVDGARLAGLDPAAFPFLTTGEGGLLGTLTLRDGQVYWNDAPLSDAQQANLAVLCLPPSGP